MAKKKLAADLDFEFRLFGLISPVKEYKLAWSINHVLNLHLVKMEEKTIQKVKPKTIHKKTKTQNQTLKTSIKNQTPKTKNKN